MIGFICVVIKSRSVRTFKLGKISWMEVNDSSSEVRGKGSRDVEEVVILLGWKTYTDVGI